MGADGGSRGESGPGCRTVPEHGGIMVLVRGSDVLHGMRHVRGVDSVPSAFLRRQGRDDRTRQSEAIAAEKIMLRARRQVTDLHLSGKGGWGHA